MKLVDLLENMNFSLISGDLNKEISGISFDSREIKSGFLFVAIKGLNTDGHKYIEKAVKLGASAVVCQEKSNQTYADITLVGVENTVEALARISNKFYNFPSRKIKLVGITGTNGKTTTATLLYKVFKSLGYKTGLISTVNNFIDEKILPTKYTTPDVLSFNSLLSQMVDEGCEYCFAEVSSHAIAQKRIEGIEFTGGVFTNLTHDHLDYHTDFSDYLKAKKIFFDNLLSTAFAVSNADDKNGKVMMQNTNAEKYYYSVKSISDFQIKPVEITIEGMMSEISGKEIWTLLTGEFNAYNLAAVYSVSVLLGVEKEQALGILSQLTPVRGRFETLKINNKNVIIDYAHSPDALINVLKTIQKIRNENQEIITVVGAGGNRDSKKRPIMAKAAVNNSDKVILTSDNPRNEDPEKIIEDMFLGVENKDVARVLKITNRKEAIKTAFILAKNNDVILIAGKGHETYQEIKGIRTHFDDREVVLELQNQ